MDKIGIECSVYGVKPIQRGEKICGRAFTVHYVPCGAVKGTVGDFLDDVEPGQVIVIDNAGRDNCTVWGDIMAKTAKKYGIAGTVIDGVCRDIPAVLECQYPIFSKGYYMRTGKDRVYVDAVNVPVTLSDIQVCPGDIVIGDDILNAVLLRKVRELLFKSFSIIGKARRSRKTGPGSDQHSIRLAEGCLQALNLL